MKTKINLLDYSLDLSKLDLLHDFYHFRTSKKYISRGALFLDNLNSSAESICFDYGISAFAMFKKGSTSFPFLEKSINDPNITIRKVDIRELKQNIILRLLINSLSNSSFDQFSFNNLTGRLYFYLPEWISKNQKYIKALDISTYQFSDKYIRLDSNATTFTQVSSFKRKPELSIPYYIFSVNKTLKRVNPANYLSVDNLYVKKTLSGKKTEIEFLDFLKTKKTSTKCYAIYSLIKIFNNCFKGMASLSLTEVEIIKKLDSKRDEDFSLKTIDTIKQRGINFVNYFTREEDNYNIDLFTQAIKDVSKDIRISLNKAPSCEGFNIAFMHDKDFYLDNNYEDPYAHLERNKVIQCVTDEEACSSLNEVIVKTIFKELAIKNDIINERKITLDNWEDYKFKDTFSFGILENDIPYFLEIKADGTFTTIKPKGFLNTFIEEKYEKYKSIMQENSNGNHMLIADDNGNINLINSTGINTFPYEEIFESGSPRSKKSRDLYLAGLTDINLYKIDDEIYYNAGVIGKGMNSSLPRGSLLYKINVVEGISIIEKLLETMSVMFVKYNSFTVLPYPFKYLREWIEMETKN